MISIPGFTRSDIQTTGARIVTVTGGSGPPLLLMHGNPFNHLSWLKVAPTLAKVFTVVATDLRGYGDSEKPPGGADHSGYSFRAMAQDQIEVMQSLGFDKFYAAGHDRGARVLHRMCLDHPNKVKRAAILDIIPQHYLLNHMTKEWGRFSWHWLFNIQPSRCRKRCMGADPDWFTRGSLPKPNGAAAFSIRNVLLADDKPCFRNPEMIHAVCEDYRATFGVAPRHGCQISTPAKIECPVLLLWGATRRRGRNHQSRPAELEKPTRRILSPPRHAGGLFVGGGAGQTTAAPREFFAAAAYVGCRRRWSPGYYAVA